MTYFVHEHMVYRNLKYPLQIFFQASLFTSKVNLQQIERCEKFSKSTWREFLEKDQKKSEFWNEYDAKLVRVSSKFETNLNLRIPK